MGESQRGPLCKITGIKDRTSWRHCAASKAGGTYPKVLGGRRWLQSFCQWSMTLHM